MFTAQDSCLFFVGSGSGFIVKDTPSKPLRMQQHFTRQVYSMLCAFESICCPNVALCVSLAADIQHVENHTPPALSF